MSRLRGYCFTVNNYTEDDMSQLSRFAVDFCTYMVCGFEVGEQGTPHIQGYMHFAEGKSMSSVHKYIPRASLRNPKAVGDKFERRYTYCMKDGDYWEYGNQPKDGAPVTAYKVKDALAEGKSMKELREIFPLYMIANGPKVKAYMSLMKGKYETQFYVCDPIADAITEVCTYFDGLDDLAIVTELSQLEAYETYENVIFMPEFYDRIYNLWPRGVPITYKYGYQQVVVKCQKFIVISSTPNLYSLYNKI